MGDGYYIERDGVPVAVSREEQIAHQRARKGQPGVTGMGHTVEFFTVGDARVSTVFLGLDHGWGEGPPVLYETMVFGGPLDGECERYCTRAEAVAGHALMVARVVAAP